MPCQHIGEACGNMRTHDMCSERALMLYILGVGLGRWAVNIHETCGRQCCRRARVVWAVSWVAMSDSRLYRWRPPEVTRGSQSMLRSWMGQTCLSMSR